MHVLGTPVIDTIITTLRVCSFISTSVSTVDAEKQNKVTTLFERNTRGRHKFLIYNI
jgi:hypothetical protein